MKKGRNRARRRWKRRRSYRNPSFGTDFKLVKSESTKTLFLHVPVRQFFLHRRKSLLIVVRWFVGWLVSQYLLQECNPKFTGEEDCNPHSSVFCQVERLSIEGLSVLRLLTESFCLSR